MRSVRASLLIAFFMAPLCLRGDATIRYHISMTGMLPPGSPLRDSDSVIYMKGNKGATVTPAGTTLVDFAKQQVTLVDPQRSKYAIIPASEYGASMAGAFPQVNGASGMLKSMKSKCDSKSTGRTEKIQGIQAEERELNCSLEISMPEGVQPPGAGSIPAMQMKLAMHIWSAAAGEKPRVPALWQLSGFELWQKYFMSPVETVRDRLPEGFTPLLDEMQKDQSVTLRSSMEMSMRAGEVDSPIIKMTQEVVELSTVSLDDSLFQVPAGYAAAPFVDVMNGMVESQMQAVKSPPALPQAPVPGNIQAYVPYLIPLSQPRPVPSGEGRGRVDLLVAVGPNGSVLGAEALSGPETLRKAAVESVGRWTYRPVIRNNVPVSAYTEATVDTNDYSKGAPPFQYSPEMAAAGERREQLQQAFPRSPQQILADLEQDAGGESKRRNIFLPQLATAAMKAAAFEKAGGYANEMLARAGSDRKDWNYGNAIYNGHSILGLLALRNNDIAEADRQLLEAGRTPGSPQLNSFGPDMTLASELLQKGERDTVLEYLELCRGFWKMGGTQLDSWSAAIRKGEMPTFAPRLN